MRETRTSGLTRGEAAPCNGLRLVRHKRGNLETDLCRHLPLATVLLYSTFGERPTAGSGDSVRDLNGKRRSHHRDTETTEVAQRKAESVRERQHPQNLCNH